MLDDKDDEERAWSNKRGGKFLPCCLCCSTCSGFLMDEEEEEEDSPVAEAAGGLLSTTSREAQTWSPASPVSAGARREGHFIPSSALSPEDTLSLETEGFFLRDWWGHDPEQRKKQK